MRKTTETTETRKLMVDKAGLQNLLSCGIRTCEEIAENAGAVFRIGKRKLYNVEKIQAYLNAHEG